MVNGKSKVINNVNTACKFVATTFEAPILMVLRKLKPKKPVKARPEPIQKGKKAKKAKKAQKAQQYLLRYSLL